MNIKCEPGDSVDLSLPLYDGATNQYPQAKIYDTSGNLIATKNLSHVANGLYQTTYTPDGSYKHMAIHYIIYSDSGHNTENTKYSRAMNKLYVNYDYKSPQFGSLTATVAKDDINKIVKAVEKKLGKDKTNEVLKELRKKSEFNPKKDKVKTDLKIPKQPSLRDIRENIEKLINEMSKQKNKEIDYSHNFKDLSKSLKKIEKNINNDKKKNIELVKRSFENLKNSVKQIQIPEIDISPIFDKLGEVLDEQLSSKKEVNSVKSSIKKTVESQITNSMNSQRQTQQNLLNSLNTFEERINKLEAMLEALNEEDFNRINNLVTEIKKLNKFQRIIASTLLQSKLGEKNNDMSEVLELLQNQQQK